MAQATTLEKRILSLFFKTVGAELGLYDMAAKQFTAGATSHGAYQENLAAIQKTLASGTPAADLEELIRERYRAGERTALITTLLKAETRPGRVGLETDLLEGHPPDHPALFDRRMPTMALTEGGLVEINGGQVKAKTRFTLAELIEFYSLMIPVNILSAKKQQGPWNWILSQGSLSEVLTAIELAHDENREVSVLELASFLPEAREIVQARQARRKEANP